MGFWPVVLNVLRNSDVVLLLVDARMPEISRNSEIIDKVENTLVKDILTQELFNHLGSLNIESDKESSHEQ